MTPSLCQHLMPTTLYLPKIEPETSHTMTMGNVSAKIDCLKPLVKIQIQPVPQVDALLFIS